jgi:hypothetical protein
MSRGDGDDRLLVGVYVEDLIVVDSNIRVINVFKE